MNALQQLIYDFKRDNPGETYASIARRASTPDHIVPRQTVYSAATTERLKQTPQPKTIAALARGMNMPVEVVGAAAADAAGYFRIASDIDDERGRLIIATVMQLDDQRLEEIGRRARFLLSEMQESAGDGGSGE